MNSRGQVLLPALAVFMGLLSLFFGIVYLGRVVLGRMRLETAAQAAALSACREQAKLLNKYAGHNLKLNGFVPLSLDGDGLALKDLQSSLELWLWEQKLELPWSDGAAKALIFATGYAVAKLNNAKTPIWALSPSEWSLQIHPEKLEVVYVLKPWPPIPVKHKKYDDAYYVREWSPHDRRVQPPHQVSWCATDGSSVACATAHLFLDVNQDVPHNGGFPRPHQKLWESFDIQSLWPQFNTRLIKTSLQLNVLAKLMKGHLAI